VTLSLQLDHEQGVVLARMAGSQPAAGQSQADAVAFATTALDSVDGKGGLGGGGFSHAGRARLGLDAAGSPSGIRRAHR
jgi:hypothetical protein